MSALQKINDNEYTYQGLNDQGEYVYIHIFTKKVFNLKLIPDFYNHIKGLEKIGNIIITKKNM